MSRRESPNAPSNQEPRLTNGLKGQAYALLSKGLQPAEIANELRVTEHKVRYMLGIPRRPIGAGVEGTAIRQNNRRISDAEVV